MKTKINLKCVASRHAADDERIIEFFDQPTQQGGLIAFTHRDDGSVLVDLYCLDDRVEVRTRHRNPGANALLCPRLALNCTTQLAIVHRG